MIWLARTDTEKKYKMNDSDDIDWFKNDNNWYIDWKGPELERVRKLKALNKGWRKSNNYKRFDIKEPEFTYFNRGE